MNKKIIAEMLTHIACSTHNNPQTLLILGDSKDILKEIAKYRIEINTTTADILSSDTKYDVIISTNTQNDSVGIYKALNDDGIYCAIDKTIYDINSTKKRYEKLGKLFSILMPYQANIDNGTTNQYFILLSKKNHPVSDIVLDRSDFLEDLYYYNTEIHKSAFEFPTHIKKELLGYIKR